MSRCALLHINILSLERGVPLDGDPNDLTDGFLEGVDRRAQRMFEDVVGPIEAA